MLIQGLISKANFWRSKFPQIRIDFWVFHDIIFEEMYPDFQISTDQIDEFHETSSSLKCDFNDLLSFLSTSLLSHQIRNSSVPSEMQLLNQS